MRPSHFCYIINWYLIKYAGVMELVDVTDSKSVGGDTVWVRVPPPAPKKEASALQMPLFWVPAAFGRLHPPVIQMLGGSEFRLRQGFACGKTLVRRRRTAPPCGAPMTTQKNIDRGGGARGRATFPRREGGSEGSGVSSRLPTLLYIAPRAFAALCPECYGYITRVENHLQNKNRFDKMRTEQMRT